MNAYLRRLLAICAAIACGVLALVVLIAHPSDTVDLLAGAGLAAAAGILVLALP